MTGSITNTVVRLALVFLSFLLGAWVAWSEGPPFEPWLREAFIGANVLMNQFYLDTSLAEHDVWMDIEDGQPINEGVTKRDVNKTSPGLTLITVSESAYLIDIEGKVRHRWRLAYNELPNTGDKVMESASHRRLYWPRAHVLPNGDLIALVVQTRTTPTGLALVKIDAQSNLKWVYHGFVHHDFDIGPDGNIYTLYQTVRRHPPATLGMFTGPVLEEGILVLSPEGEEIRQISILDAIGRSIYAPLADRYVVRNKRHWGDYLHNNNVDVATTATAATHDFIEPGQILLSVREVDMIAVLDPEQEIITWAARGSWRRQHDPDFLPNGNIMIFDNNGDWDRGGQSRIIEYDPRTESIAWQYPDGDNGQLWSYNRGEQQLLPNGNILINEFQQRRLLEVTRDGEVVWEYRCPFRSDQKANLVCRTMSSRRYSPEELSLPFGAASDAQSALTPGDEDDG